MSDIIHTHQVLTVNVVSDPPDTSGQKRPHLSLCPGPNVPLQGRQRSRGCILDAPEESGLISRGRKGLCSALESRQVFLGDKRVIMTEVA